ncbi:MAG: hypothetical protein ACO20G_02210 [Ilumatobacteraceae bacterium]
MIADVPRLRRCLPEQHRDESLRLWAPDGTAPALMIDMATVAGLSDDAAVVVVNVTAANTTTSAVNGYVSLYPCATASATPPNVSTLNFATGDIVANGALVRLDSGRMCVYSYGTTDVIIDLAGWFTD